MRPGSAVRPKATSFGSPRFFYLFSALTVFVVLVLLGGQGTGPALAEPGVGTQSSSNVVFTSGGSTSGSGGSVTGRGAPPVRRRPGGRPRLRPATVQGHRSATVQGPQGLPRALPPLSEKAWTRLDRFHRRSFCVSSLALLAHQATASIP